MLLCGAEALLESRRPGLFSSGLQGPAARSPGVVLESASPCSPRVTTQKLLNILFPYLALVPSRLPEGRRGNKKRQEAKPSRLMYEYLHVLASLHLSLHQT